MSLTVGKVLSWRVVPTQFHVVIPDTWDSDQCDQLASAPGQVSAPVPVSPTDISVKTSSSWQSPVTHQSRGCGQQGDNLEIPMSWVDSYNGTTKQAELLAWQFIKLRFGVFSQSGFTNDPIYPPGESVTCQDVINCQTESEGSKHERLCSGRSVRTVIEESLDFSRLKNHINTPNMVSFVPEFVFVQNKPEQIVILLETASTLQENDQWRYIAKTVKNLILYQLPENTMFSLITFSDTTNVEVPMTRLDSGTRSRVADIVPDKYRLSSSKDTCVECGLTRVFNSLHDLISSTHVILITSNTSISNVISEDILEYVDKNPIKVSTIVLSSRPVYYYDNLARITNGQVATVDETLGHVTKYIKLMNSVQSIVKLNSVLTAHENIVNISKDNLETRGEFELASDSEDSEMFIIVDDVYNHLVQSVQFSQYSQDVVHGPYHNLVTSRAGVNMLSLYQSPLTSVGAGDKWGYKIQWYHPERSTSVDAAVVVHTRSKKQRYEVSMWTSSDTLTNMVTPESPLILYVSVTQSVSSLVVLRAKVIVHCKVTNDNDSVETCEDIELYDNGAGDPDITADDGVYSRYLVKYPGPGRYEFSVTVTDNEDDAFVAIPRDIDYDTLDNDTINDALHDECCGSRVSLHNKRITNTGTFSVTTSGSVKHLVQVYNSGDGFLDRSPPAQVGDLQIKTQDAGHILVSFTAPGDDLDHGVVDTYKLLASRNRFELLNESLIEVEQSDLYFTTFKSEKAAGEQISYLFSFDVYNEDIFLAVIGVDDAGNIGKVSNIAKVHLPHITSDALSEAVPATEDVSVAKSEDFSLILALSGAIVFLSSFLALGILYFIKVLKARKIVGSVHHEISTSNNSSHDSSQTQKTLISQSLGQSTPTYWSATDLLSKHESKIGDRQIIQFSSLPQSHQLQHDRQFGKSVARELFLDSISEEDEITEESSDDGIQDHGYRDDTFGIKKPAFHQKHFSLV